MRYENGKALDLRLAYIGGGSRGWAWNFMTDLAIEPALGGEVALYDIDREAAEANRIIGGRVDAQPETRGHWRYRVCDSLRQALTGADFVVISILPGTFDEMEADVHLPERLGIYQSVGDTTGPGGIIRALRALPMFVPIAEAIRDYCPEAWVINYTNPMSLCVKTLYEIFPGIKAFGCCHEVFGTQELLAHAAADMLGVPVPPRQEIHTEVLGINHFTWFRAASWQGVDLFPLYRAFTEKYRESGFQEPGRNWLNSSFDCAHLVKFDLFRRFGWIAAAGDRHLAEFMPGDEYLADPETVARWKFGLTPVSWRKADLAQRLEKSARLVRGGALTELKPSGEEGVLLMKALLGLERVISNVNLPNAGQISNLPLGTVVETNAVFARDRITPLLAGELTPEIRALTLPHVENQARTLRAALDCDPAPVAEAFLRDPNTRAKCRDRGTLEALAADMIAATARFLPEAWRR
ncbi:MAG: alpha-glucosidase/alpha-galactosidase [Oscillospiraceae bacterium]|nr:alpha-glucosidase/alpha-galactosidase [Oscillospiraceae bacterium]